MRVFVALLVSTLLFAPAAASACSCSTAQERADGDSVSRAKETAHAVFAGKVRRVVFDTDSRLVRVVFDVERTWKGNVGSEAVVLTGRGNGDCGYGFFEGEKYLVYAYGDDARLGTSICQRTRPIAKAEGDEKLLGRGTKPKKTR